MTLSVYLCPCMSLQQGVKILAIIDAVLSTIIGVLYTLGLVLFLLNGEEWGASTEEKTAVISILVIAIIIAVLQILLAFRLYYGGVNRDSRNCRIWLIVSIVIVAVLGISFIVNLTAGGYNNVYGAGSVVGLVYKIYEMLVVTSFIKELGNDMHAIGVY